MNPLISILIPSKDQLNLLEKCLKSIFTKTEYLNYEIIIINNNSKERDTYKFFRKIRKEVNVLVFDYNHHFTFSAINNFAAKKANGKILLFLNNDTEVINPGWLIRIAAYGIKPEIGAVGVLLLYPNKTIQHAGVYVDEKVLVGHIYLHWKLDDFKKNKNAYRVQEYPAVTGACMAIEKKKFVEVGGFDDKHLPIAFNDIDLCLKLRERGYKNIFTPYVQLYHHESASRGYEDTLLKKLRFWRELHYMRRKWGSIIKPDQHNQV